MRPKAAQGHLSGTALREHWGALRHARLPLPLATPKAVLACLDYSSGVVGTLGPVRRSSWVRKWKEYETVQAWFQKKLN